MASNAVTQGGSGNRQLIEQFIQFYRDYCRDEIGRLAQRYPNEQRSLEIDFSELYTFSRGLAEDYVSQPEQYIELAEEALTEFDLPADVNLSDAHVRVVNLDDPVGIRNLRVDDDALGTLIAVEGVVRKATDVRPKITDAAFECQRCGTMSYVPQSSGGFEEPHECQGCERQGPFHIDFDQSNFVDSQKLRVQESPEGLRGGETPQSIDVQLTDDICGKVTPGDKVSVTGILHIEQKTAGNDKTPIFEYYLEGRSVKPEDETTRDLDLTQEEKAEIRATASADGIYQRLVNSIAPGIYGHDEKKLALVLQAFSGPAKHLPDGSRIRGDLHVLFIGDPGTGKSAMLQYMKNVVSRSVYTSGKGSSAAGLTAAAVRDDFSEGNQWTLEAGAVVLADQGLAAVDEIDKMRPEDRSALHEALEQQTVSVSKAGINASLKSRCALLAAANPEYGRFDEYEPIGEQIDMEPALISRFDLIFTFSDTPEVSHDTRLADHILETNQAGQLNAYDALDATPGVSEDELEEKTAVAEPDIDNELLRKYIGFAKLTCAPVLTDDAKAKLRDFYVNIRNEGRDEDSPVPVTARKLEALVRLAEASARIRLANEITVEDANRVIDIVQSCLEDIGMDPETGELDADVVETGTSKSQRDRIHNLIDLIEDMSGHYEDGEIPKADIVDSAEENLGIDERKVKDTMKKLRLRKGELMEPKQGYVRLA